MEELNHIKEVSDIHKKEWETHLSEEEKIQFNSDLEDYKWYSIIANDKAIAIFQIINVLDEYSKNLDIRFHPTQEQQDHEELITIIIFIFNSIIDICNDKKIRKIKFHTHNSLMHIIFTHLSDEYVKNKVIEKCKKYGKWIEVYTK